MIRDFFVTKRDMCQAWTKQGRRLAVSCVYAPDIKVINKKSISQDSVILEVGFGKKKLKNMAKPLQTQIKRSGFSVGIKQMRGIRVETKESDSLPKAGDSIKASDVLAVGDMIDVQGISKGRGFAGAIKRHGFHGGPKTHGQSDRARAVGSIGAGTTPGRVWPGKKMPGHYGVETKTVQGLVVLYIDPETDQIWINGPIPGSFNSLLRIRKIGKTSKIELDKAASGLPVEEKTEVNSAEDEQPITPPGSPLVPTSRDARMTDDKKSTTSDVVAEKDQPSESKDQKEEVQTSEDDKKDEKTPKPEVKE